MISKGVNWILISIYLLSLCVYIYVCLCDTHELEHMPSMNRNQRTIFTCWFSPFTLWIQDISCGFCGTVYFRVDVSQVGDSSVFISHLQKSAVVTNAYDHFLCRFLGLNSNCQACIGYTFIFLVILMIPSSPISKDSMKTLYIPSHGVKVILSLIPYIIVSYHHCVL